MDCIFCRIVKKEIPCYNVYEDSNFLAFLDISPRNPGHTLVIPKKHYRWVWDVENIGEYYSAVKKVAGGLKKAFETDFIFSAVIGEEVPHAHVWLVPRLKNDGHGGALDFSRVVELSPEQMKKIQENIKKNI